MKSEFSATYTVVKTMFSQKYEIISFSIQNYQRPLQARVLV
jgi:hypothetical protein